VLISSGLPAKAKSCHLRSVVETGKTTIVTVWSMRIVLLAGAWQTKIANRDKAVLNNDVSGRLRPVKAIEIAAKALSVIKSSVFTPIAKTTLACIVMLLSASRESGVVSGESGVFVSKKGRRSSTATGKTTIAMEKLTFIV
jgi:hypothetical protein